MGLAMMAKAEVQTEAMITVTPQAMGVVISLCALLHTARQRNASGWVDVKVRVVSGWESVKVRAEGIVW